MRDDFAVFICTHGRPNKQHTYNTLRHCGYTGTIYFIVDNTDNTIQDYIDNYGVDNIFVFDKNYYINSDKYDNGDNVLHDKCIVYAKRAVEDIAKSMSLKYFAISDDDITNFVIRYPNKSKLSTYPITNLDLILDNYINILYNNVAGIGFGYSKSYFKGYRTFDYTQLSNRSMPYQFVIRNADIDVVWSSWFGEDDITELCSSSLGKVWLSIPYVMQVMKTIGNTNTEGGMVDVYKQFDTFKLNFNIVKYCPGKTRMMYYNNKFTVAKKVINCFPKIISEVYKKYE